MRTSTRSSKPVSRSETGAEAIPRRPSRPLLMGIVNSTPDSFYPGSRGGLDHALRLIDEGADWIDVGGQSTRPGSDPISADEELRRVLPIVEQVAKRAVVSVDTDKPEVARRAREAGAKILNDVTALRNGCMAEAVQFERVILMHMGGESPKTMQQDPRYEDVVAEVKGFLRERLEAFVSAGGRRERALVDPGIGFGKNLDHNLSLLKHLEELAEIGPVALGASRKSFLARITADSGPHERLEGSLAAAIFGAMNGAAVLRVHDVAATRRAVEALCAIEEAA